MTVANKQPLIIVAFKILNLYQEDLPLIRVWQLNCVFYIFLKIIKLPTLLICLKK